MDTIAKKNFNSPDETASPAADVSIATVNIGGLKLQKVTAMPGWTWSKSLKPIQKTDSCQKHHILYMLSGRLAARMNDGTELEYAAGDFGEVSPGHDGWTVGDEAAVWIELPH